MTNKRLLDVVAIVTGAASGIGEAVANHLASEGASVALVDTSRSVVRVAQHIGKSSGRAVRGNVADACDSAALDEVMAEVRHELGVAGVLVNNAWSGSGTGALDTTETQWNQTLRGTLTSAFVFSRAVLPQMIGAGTGVIVNISSVNAERFIGHDAYSAAKAGVMSITRSMAAQHGNESVRVNAILAGSIDTPARRKRGSARPRAFEELIAYYPLGRLGTKADVAIADGFFVSEDAAWVTGVALPVEGGHLDWNGDFANVAELEAIGVNRHDHE